MFFFWCKITTAHWRWPYTIFSICCTIIMTVPKKELSETLPLRLVSFSYELSSKCLFCLAVAAKHVDNFVLIQVNHILTSLAAILTWVEVFWVQCKCFTHTGSECQT